MSKADLLGGSATFDAVAQPMSSRAKAFAAFSGQTPEPLERTEAAPTRLSLDLIAHNPHNPREKLTAVRSMADSLEGRGVIQPITVVTRDVFLVAHPDDEELIGQAAYVVVDGNRRFAGAKLAGLDDIPVYVNDELAEDADTMLEAALITAVQHEALDPLDEAKALQRLVGVHGSQRAVARALAKSSGWVTQRLALLKLTPELQQAVEDKSLTVEVARRVGQLPPQQQYVAAQEAMEERAAAPKQRNRTRTVPDDRKGAYGVSTPPTPAAEPSRSAAESAYAVSTPAESFPDTAVVKKPGAADEGPVSLQENIPALAADLRMRLTEEQLHQLIELLMD